MTMLMVMPLVIASLLFGGCGKETKRTAAEAVPSTEQRRTVPNSNASPDHPKKPPVRQPEEGSDRTKAVRNPTAEEKHEKQTAGLPRSRSDRDGRKQAEAVTPLAQSEREADVAVTQRIRQALMREDFSFTARKTSS